MELEAMLENRFVAMLDIKFASFEDMIKKNRE